MGLLWKFQMPSDIRAHFMIVAWAFHGPWCLRTSRPIWELRRNGGGASISAAAALLWPPCSAVTVVGGAGSPTTFLIPLLNFSFASIVADCLAVAPLPSSPPPWLGERTPFRVRSRRKLKILVFFFWDDDFVFNPMFDWLCCFFFFWNWLTLRYRLVSTMVGWKFPDNGKILVLIYVL